jgi:hypothetical protein
MQFHQNPSVHASPPHALIDAPPLWQLCFGTMNLLCVSTVCNCSESVVTRALGTHVLLAIWHSNMCLRTWFHQHPAGVFSVCVTMSLTCPLW